MTVTPSEGAAALMRHWLAQLGAVRGMSPRTIEAYGADVAGYLGFLAGHWGGPAGAAALGRVSTSDLRAWMAQERAERPRPRSCAIQARRSEVETWPRAAAPAGPPQCPARKPR